MRLDIFLIAAIATIFVDCKLLHGKSTRLIKTDENEPARWMSESEIWTQVIRKRKRFIDFTHHQQLFHRNWETKAPKGVPTKCTQQTKTNALINSIDIERVKTFLQHFSSYYNRLYTSDLGAESQKWLLSQIEETLSKYNAAPVTTLMEFDHEDYPQKSIIARIVGSNSSLATQVIVFGAHLDSMNADNHCGKAPGADDNGAGSAVLLEILNAVVDQNHAPSRTLEFHWYAGEEGGLLGSMDVAKSYSDVGVDVISMFNVDMPGFQTPDLNDVAIHADNITDPDLVTFLGLLVDEYLEYGKQQIECGYACSDHASWQSYGFPVAFTSEVHISPHWHKDTDTYDTIGFTQVKEFIKLFLAIVVEYGESGTPTKNK